MRNTLCVVVVIAITAATASAAGLSYVEQWDLYAPGESDPTYTSIWSVQSSVSPDPPALDTTKRFSPNNSALVLQQNRAISNSLVDGVGPNEMLAGQTVNGVGSPGSLNGTAGTDLELGMYLHQSAAGSRGNTSQYVEISMNGQHAPDPSNYASYGLAGPTDPLPAPIPVIAFGKLNGQWTGSTGDGAKNTLFFFNGQQWINTFLAIGTNANGFNRAWLSIGSTTADALVFSVGSNGAGSPGSNGGFSRAYLGGFNTISFRYFNAGQSISGTSATDDIYLVGGVVVPEPAMIALVGMGLPIVLRRRRRVA